MPASATIGQIGRTDFLAIMAPGFFVLVVIFFSAAAINEAFDQRSPSKPDETDGANLAVTDQAAQLSIDERPFYEQLLTSNWPLALVALVFATYVVGSVPRTVTVNTADSLCAMLFSALPRREWDQALHESNFPYRMALQRTLDALQVNGLYLNVGLPEPGTSHTMFNSWKVTICHKSPSAFAYTQALEARTRLFAGMFWAAAVGVMSSILVFTTFLVLLLGWWWSAGLALAIALALAFRDVIKRLIRNINARLHFQRFVDPSMLRSLGSGKYKLLLCVAGCAISFAAVWVVALINDLWIYWNTIILVVSLAIAASYGLQLRRVRGQESVLMFLTYLSLPHEGGGHATSDFPAAQSSENGAESVRPV
jgi:hypothetical protein